MVLTVFKGVQQVTAMQKIKSNYMKEENKKLNISRAGLMREIAKKPH